MDNTQNIISFCTGYGGIELGIKRTGLPVRTVAYVEIEAFACANLVAKIEQGKMDAAPIWSNLKTFDGRPFRGKVHGIIGGYPCQPFSNAGQRKGTEDPRHLFPYICEHIRTIRPLWCFFENVGGHLNLGFDEVYKSLRDLGYKVEAIIASAEEVGSPHLRERLFIMAYADLQPDGQDAGGNGKTKAIQGINRQALCRGRATRAGEQLAVTELCRHIHSEPQEQSTEAGIDALCQFKPSRKHKLVKWPARPGRPQFDWEESRTLAGRKVQKSDDDVESGMGRTVDGFASRVDELRLLGNGVVPQTAELAFRTLWNKICPAK